MASLRFKLGALTVFLSSAGISIGGKVSGTNVSKRIISFAPQRANKKSKEVTK